MYAGLYIFSLCIMFVNYFLMHLCDDEGKCLNKNNPNAIKKVAFGLFHIYRIFKNPVPQKLVIGEW